MSGKILIIDSVATNRIILKVKLLSAQYDVTAVSNQQQAQAVIAHDQPDLILIDLADRSEDRHAFCTALRDNLSTSDIAVLGTGTANTAAARLAALDVGVKDLLPAPINDTFLLARVRSLLRIKHVHSEIWVRDTAGRALGFEEDTHSFRQAARIHLLTPSTTVYPTFVRDAAANFSPNAHVMSLDRYVTTEDHKKSPDLYIIDATTLRNPHDALFQLSADLRSRTASRLAAQLVVVPPEAVEIAAAALDLGADDVVMADVSSDEIARRSHILLEQKHKRDRFHTTVKDGLLAAVTDPLTGLYNRRYADPYLTALAEKSSQSQQDFAIMMVDIDHFKAVNDTYGHATGDAILVTLAQRLRDNLRGIDLIARIGGEEFLVALPQSNREMAETTADRLRQAVNETPFVVGPCQHPLSVTVSIGVAVGETETAKHISTEEVCHLADTALYAAKSGGRNQVSFAA